MNDMKIEPLIKELQKTQKKLQEVKAASESYKGRLYHAQKLLTAAQSKIDGTTAALDQTRSTMLEMITGMNYILKGKSYHGNVLMTAVEMLEYEGFWRDHKLTPLGQVIEKLLIASRSIEEFNKLTVKYRS